MLRGVCFGIALLTLAGCGVPPSHCENDKVSDGWMTQDVTTRQQLRAEISDVIRDNHCRGITPEQLRKIFLDMEKIAR